MQRDALFDLWADDGLPWSAWVKPVLFMHLNPDVTDQALDLVAEARTAAAPWQPIVRADTAIVLDLPIEESIRTGFALAFCAMQPVPIFTAVPHAAAIRPLDRAMALLARSADVIAQATHGESSPPAFLLDRDRRDGTPGPSRFDNRSLVFPQDFPSGTTLRRAGVNRSIYVATAPPADDLAHVLLGWQQAGMVIERMAPGGMPESMSVRRPSGFRSILRPLLGRLGLRPNSAGGFGGLVPTPSSGG